MESVLKDMAPDAREGAMNYVAKKEIPQLFGVSLFFYYQYSLYCNSSNSRKKNIEGCW